MERAPRLAAVVGWPIAHSLSPLIHRYWSDREGANAHYVPVAAPPTDADFAGVISGLRAAGFRGVNVTLPHKERALHIADRRSALAEDIGAANMLTFNADGVYADNSDADGFAEAVRAVSERPVTHALLLGAGGAAQAVAAALRSRLGAARITVANRTRSRAEALAARVNGDVVDWDNINAELARADLVVNATSLGMEGQPPLALDYACLQAGAIVSDIVYRPLETLLLATARARGCIVVDGLEMLMRQAVPGYKSWLGETASVDADLRATLLAALSEA